MMYRAMGALLAGILLCGCTRGDGDQILGTLERDRLELTAEGHEPIQEIVVREGDAVAADAMLLRQSLGAMQARLDQAEAASLASERRLAELVKGPRSQEIMEARAALDAAASSLITATNEYRRVQDLIERNLVSKSALDAARTQRDSAEGLHKQARARLDLLLEGTRREEIEQAEAAVKQAHAAFAELKTSADRYTIAAPRPGRIEAIPYKLGERPPVGAPLIVMLADGAPYARVYVPETRRLQFSSGSRVRVRVDGREESFAGVVRFISAQAAFTPYYALTQEDRTRLSYLAEIDLTEAGASELPTGIPVQISLEGEQES
jgi:HlyD family secretion protein